MASTSGIRKRKMQLCEEPSTLVYTLLNTKKLPFDHFSLIIRSLHSYMVDAIIPSSEENCVRVKLLYQASVKNARAKLGKLSKFVTVHKMSQFIEDKELPLLDKLKSEFGFGVADDEAKTTSKSNKKPKLLQEGQYLENTEMSEGDSE